MENTSNIPLCLDQEFPLNNEIIYLNHAFMSPLPNRTCQALEHFAIENMTQGAKDYSHWVATEFYLREQLRKLLNAPAATDIALLKNAAEGLSTVAYGLEWQAGDNIIFIDQEIPSNCMVWESLHEQEVKTRKINVSDTIEPEELLFSKANKNTRLIVVNSVQYANGLRVDLQRIGKFCQENNILFCVDASQSLGALQFDVQTIQADFVVADGHKWMLSTEGLAVFYCKYELRKQLELKQYGWCMLEDSFNFEEENNAISNSTPRLECGSLNRLGICALSSSLSLLEEVGINNIEKQVLDNTSFLLYGLKRSPYIQILSNQEQKRRSGIISFCHTKLDSNLLFKQLSQQGVICSQFRNSIHFSPHFYTQQAKLEQVIDYVLHI